MYVHDKHVFSLTDVRTGVGVGGVVGGVATLGSNARAVAASDVLALAADVADMAVAITAPHTPTTAMTRRIRMTHLLVVGPGGVARNTTSPPSTEPILTAVKYRTGDADLLFTIGSP